MNIVLLSGGSGKRLWPLSNDIRSKQFIKIFKKPEHDIPMGTDSGEYESMVQRVYRQIKTVDADATVTIATSKSQVSAIHNQLGEGVQILCSMRSDRMLMMLLLKRFFLYDCNRRSVLRQKIVLSSIVHFMVPD